MDLFGGYLNSIKRLEKTVLGKNLVQRFPDIRESRLKFSMHIEYDRIVFPTQRSDHFLGRFIRTKLNFTLFRDPGHMLFNMRLHMKKDGITHQDQVWLFTNGFKQWKSKQIDQSIFFQRLAIKRSLERGWTYRSCHSKFEGLGVPVCNQDGPTSHRIIIKSTNRNESELHYFHSTALLSCHRIHNLYHISFIRPHISCRASAISSSEISTSKSFQSPPRRMKN